VSRIEIVLAVVQCGALICLAKRSESVSTGQGLWSVVTGYVEADADPMTQAWTEVQEELLLSPPRLRFVRRLDPVPLTSPSSGKEFLVHPFLFECDSSDDVVLNWEHDDVQWTNPSRLLSRDCVTWQFPLVDALLQAA
jgi:8-oxo-dGTP pyrophosphatase MutT (NUDIX family)